MQASESAGQHFDSSRRNISCRSSLLCHDLLTVWSQPVHAFTFSTQKIKSLQAHEQFIKIPERAEPLVMVLQVLKHRYSLALSGRPLFDGPSIATYEVLVAFDHPINKDPMERLFIGAQLRTIGRFSKLLYRCQKLALRLSNRKGADLFRTLPLKHCIRPHCCLAVRAHCPVKLHIAQCL